MLGAGAILDPTIPVIDAETGEELERGVVPPVLRRGAVVGAEEVHRRRVRTPCILIRQRLEPGERTHLNDILREQDIAT